jgi:hypothetical protein
MMSVETDCDVQRIADRRTPAKLHGCGGVASSDMAAAAAEEEEEEEAASRRSIRHTASAVARKAKTNLIHTHSPHTTSSSRMICTLAAPKLHPQVMDMIGRKIVQKAGAYFWNRVERESVRVATTSSAHAYAHCTPEDFGVLHGAVMSSSQNGRASSLKMWMLSRSAHMRLNT